MASDNEASCESDPNFAVICAFMEKFGGTCGLAAVDFLGLQEMLENTQEVPQELIDLHIKLLRKSRKTVSNERWEKAVIKFCHSFCVQDAWEIERFGYKKARLSSKLRVLKELLEMQFDYNARFKAEINKMSAEELRSQPLGKDKHGHAYWFQNDNNCQIRVYKEDPDEETWTLVAKDRDGLASLIGELSDGDSKLSSESGINEDDSNSLAEKPIIDTGQVDSSSESTKKTPTDSENSNSNENDVGSKRSRESDDETDVGKKPKLLEVGKAIEEPLMLVKGEGAGDANNAENPIVGDEIEEEVMFFCGVGNGVDCETGNGDKPSSESQQPEQQNSGDADTARSSDYSISASDTTTKKCGEVPTSSNVKSSYKLGTIIDTKTDNRLFHSVAARNPTKKSRWDVETIVDKQPEAAAAAAAMEDEGETVPKKKTMFFFGPGCLQFGPKATVGFGQKVPQEVLRSNAKGDIGYRIEKTNDCVQDVVQQTPIASRIEDKCDDGEQAKVEERLEEQIVPEAGVCDRSSIGKIPEVTAVLVGCDEMMASNSVNDKGSDSVPAIEELCVKKHAYVLGDDEKKRSVEDEKTVAEDVLESKTEEQPVQNHEPTVDQTCPNQEEQTPKSQDITSDLESQQNEALEDSKNTENVQESEESSIKDATCAEDLKIERVKEEKESGLLGNVEEANRINEEAEDNQIAPSDKIEAETFSDLKQEFDNGEISRIKDQMSEVSIAEAVESAVEVGTKEATEIVKTDETNDIKEIGQTDDDAAISAKDVREVETTDEIEDSAKVQINKEEKEESKLEVAATAPEDVSEENSHLDKIEVTCREAKDTEVIEDESTKTTLVDSVKESEIDEREQSKNPVVDIKLDDVKHEENSEGTSSQVVEAEETERIIPDVAALIEKPKTLLVDKIEESNIVETTHLKEVYDLKIDKTAELKNEEDVAAKIEDTKHHEITTIQEIDKIEEKQIVCVAEDKEIPKLDPETRVESTSEEKVEEETKIDVSQSKREDSVCPQFEETEIRKEDVVVNVTETIEIDKLDENSEKTKSVEVSDNEAPEIDKMEDIKPVEDALQDAQPPQMDKFEKTEVSAVAKDENNVSECLVTKEAVVVLDTLKIDVANNSNKTAAAAKNRKNNSDKTPKITTRRTRSTKNEEDAADDGLTILQPQRRPRPRTSKSEKDEDGKKMKMSGEETSEDSNSAITTATETVLLESNSSSNNSNDVMELPERDPLAVSEDDDATKTATEESKEEKPATMSLATFSLDFTESPVPPTPPLTRSTLRKRGHESPPNSEEVEERPGKRQKMKAKRAVDVKLRKSIEEQKKKELVSSDDDTTKSEQGEEKKKHKKVEQEEGVVNDKEAVKKNKKNKNKRLLSNLGIDPERILIEAEATIGVRQSRRIAQLKIKEEAERRKLEEDLVIDSHKKKKSKKSEDKDYKVEKKRVKNDNDDDEAGEDDSRDSKKKKKRKKKHKLFDELNPWRSSSDSSTSEEEEEEEIAEESDEALQYVSDHEFSPESDMEGDGEAQPLKRARTARKESDVEEEIDDCPCQKCGKSDHPEWILLCDQCDNGWHCSCLRPPLLVIPEGDWFCPPCQHSNLLNKLQEKLTEYDKKLSKKEIEDRRKQRLAYVGISLNSVLPENVKKRRLSAEVDDDDDDDDDEEEDDRADADVVADEEDDSSSDESASESLTEESKTPSVSASDDDEPIYQLRQRRQAHSYRFNDYDELINSAIQDEMEAVKGAGNQGRGKDIATIVNAEKEEEERKKESTEVEAEAEVECEREPLPPVVPLNDRDKEAKPLYSDEEPIGGSRKKIIGRKKHRKLNSLDISSEDEDSDEDFKGTSSESDDDFEEDLGSEDSEEFIDRGRGRKKGSDPIRRSTRARTSRYDADFIDDGDSEEEEEAPRRKKKRSIWDESESEESDRSWGRRKRKPAPSRQKKTGAGPAAANTPSSAKKKKSKKKKKENDDSDAEVYKKKKPKIKFGMDGENEGPIRRTRGKKINYVDALGSDSEEDRVKRPPPRIESEEEYVADEDDDEEGAAATAKLPKIQSYADPQFTRLLPEGVPTPRVAAVPAPPPVGEDVDDEPNPIDQINRNVEMMDENEMEKMMEEEEYANKQLQMVAMQLEKEKRRKEREAKKLEEKSGSGGGGGVKKAKEQQQQFQFSGSMQEPIIGNVDNLMVNSENNDELSEPPGVSLPMFAELGTGGGDSLEDLSKKRRGKNKKSLEEAVANLGSTRQQPESFVQSLPTDLSSQDGNIEIAAPPQPFSQSQPTPSVITRMLQSKPGQPGYPVGTIRPKQFAAMPEREEELHHGQYIQGLRPYRPMPPTMNHYPPRAPPPPPHPLRNPSPMMYHPHRPMDPSPSGGGTIPMPPDHSSPGRVVSPAASSPGSNKNETPPPPYSRPPPPPPPVVGRFPIPARHMHLAPPHLRPNLPPYHPGLPAAAAAYHYGQFEDALPPTIYQSASPYAEQFAANEAPPLDNSNNKSFDEESGGEFGGLVSYFSSQREDDLES